MKKNGLSGKFTIIRMKVWLSIFRGRNSWIFDQQPKAWDPPKAGESSSDMLRIAWGLWL